MSVIGLSQNGILLPGCYISHRRSKVLLQSTPSQSRLFESNPTPLTAEMNNEPTTFKRLNFRPRTQRNANRVNLANPSGAYITQCKAPLACSLVLRDAWDDSLASTGTSTLY
jgi:hypothetical protein